MSVKSDFKKVNKKSNMIRLALLMKPHIKKILWCAVCVIIVNVAILINPLIAGYVIDGIKEGAAQIDLGEITFLGIAYFLVAVVGGLGTMTQMRLITQVSQSILNYLRVAVFDKILHMPIKTLDRYGTGRLITRATNDIETINEFYSRVFINLFRDVFLILGIVVVMLWIDMPLALVALTGVPVIVALTFSIKRIIKRNFVFIKQVIGRINGFISENVAGIRIIQSFNAQKAKLKEFRDLNKNYFKGVMTQVALNTVLRPVIEVIDSLVTALLVAYGYYRITGNTLDVGILYAFTTYIKRFFNPINDLAEKYTTVQSAFVSADRIYEILDSTDSENMLAGKHSGKVKGKIEFKNVWFAYNDEDWVLKDVSFVIEAGSRAAFVGATGSGKTTIINLITKYYTVQKGTVLVDDVPVEDWVLEDLRAGCTVVLQDVFLFTGTIEENVRVKNSIDSDTVDKALKTVQAEEFINRAGGKEALVTEQGLNFSVGERQLISFARAIACEPGILVLDEATAHVDTNTEEKLQQAINEISKERTSVFIAHRLSTIRESDVIYVISKGEIKEHGNHNELMALDGMYANLVKAHDESISE